MKTYRFYDWDDIGSVELDIAGAEYRRLLEGCFRHCASVSLVLMPDFRDNLDAWEEFRIPVTDPVLANHGSYRSATGQESEIRHYRLTEQVHSLILSRADSLFSWTCCFGHDNPDDLSFFRADGSLFFTSTVHEGNCTLHLREGEAVELGGHWFDLTGHC